MVSVSSCDPSAIPISNAKVTTGCITTKNRSQIIGACYPRLCLERIHPFPWAVLFLGADCHRLLRSPVVPLQWDPKATQRWRSKPWMGTSFAWVIFLFWTKTVPLMHRKARKQQHTEPVRSNPLQLFNSFFCLPVSTCIFFSIVLAG